MPDKTYDLAIRGGALYDGTGNPPYRGDVLIGGDMLTVSTSPGHDLNVRQTIDASDLAVAPGFIDMHAHSALMILANPRHEPKVRQGITTELIGVDGNSYAPFRSQTDFRDFVRLNSGLDGDPAVDVNWSSVDDYLACYDQRVGVNIAYIVGNSPLRISSVGWGDGAATSAHLADMRQLLAEALEQGSFGLSTGLDYPPGEYANTDELVALAEVAASHGGVYHTHVRNRLGDRFLDPLREAIDIGRRSGVPVHITHLYRRVWHTRPATAIIQLLEDARSEQIDVTFDSYPYKYGSSRLVMMLPPWTHVGGPNEIIKVLESADGRRRVRADMKPRGSSWQEIWLTNFRNDDNQQFEGLSVSEISKLRDEKDEIETVCNLLLEEEMRISFVNEASEGFTRSKFLTHPLGMIGSDGLLIGDYPSPRTYGTFPELVGEFSRDEGFLSLPDAIRRMTSFAAQRLGLQDRGLLRTGMKADVVVFDPGTIGSPATRTSPKLFPTGIEYVIVNGVPVVSSGEHTGALPGRALKSGDSI